MVNFKSSTSVQQFIRTPPCQVCLEPYDSKRRTPKILQCAHTVCESCINALEEQGRRRPHNLDKSMVCIACPICRAVTQTSRSCIRTNYQLIDVIDGMSQEATHNVVFVNCIECEGVYHEKDVNICTKCTQINETTSASELVSRDVSLHRYSLCSTCLLRSHISKGHSFIQLQPLRIEMQRVENIRRIIITQEKLTMVQLRFRERLDQTMAKWILWGGNHELNMSRFREASDSFQQKMLFEKFMEELTKKTEQIEKLLKHVQLWSDELEKEMPRPEFLSRIDEGTRKPSSSQPPRPQTPGVQLRRPPTPHSSDDFVYYFERP